MSSPIVLVLRATGSQGLGVVKNAQNNGIKIRAYVPDASASRAKELLQYGAELYEGTLKDPGALENALTGCTGVFLNQMPSFTDESEKTEAKLLLETAQRLGVKHVVHSTSLGVPRKDKWIVTSGVVSASVVGKADVEDVVRASGLEYWTILRGGYFNTNFLGYPSKYMFPELGTEKKFVCSYKPDLLLPLVDPKDIGAFAIAAFREPAKFNQAVIPIVAEKRTVEQIVKDLGKASGYDIEAVYRSEEETNELAKTNPIIAAAKSLNDLHEEADIEGVKKWGIIMKTFPEFLAHEKAAVEATFDGKIGAVTANFGSLGAQ